MIKKYVYYSFIILFVLTSCSKNNESNNQINMDKIKNISQNKWDQLSKQKIYFGHQSVGYNIMDGMELVLKENPNIKLRIKKGKDSDLFKNPVFAHDNNGSNRDPKSKIDDFYNTVQKIGYSIDIAGFKFCYVDLEDGSDVSNIIEYYKKKMNQLIKKYPKVRFIHFTTPIKSLQSGPKGFLKKILGKDVGIKDNTVRQQFNELLVNEYKDQPIFDLAKAESTYSDGSREYSEVDGIKIFTMIPAYTNDGGHLSKKGKINISSQLLILLAELSDGGSN